MKLPAFQFYPGDWRKDTGVQSLDYEARGVWFEILCLMHESERRGILELNLRAMPDDALARLLGITEVLLKQILSKIEAHGVVSRESSSGALMCRRMVRDENLRKIRQNAGKQGGNPVLLNQNPTTRVKQNPTPSSSSSSSSSSSDKDISPAKRIYALYPRKVGAKAALRAIGIALKSLGEERLSNRVSLFAQAVGKWPPDQIQFIPHPATWFNQGRYDDDPDTWARTATNGHKINRPEWA